MKQINTYINEKLRLTTKRTYTCHPEDADELRKIITQRIEDEGPECDLNDIDVSKITDMGCLFDVEFGDFKDFNGDISMWDVSNVKYMNSMFEGCKKFNCDLSKWDVSNVEGINYMFYNCKEFNQDLDSWNVSKVTTMYNIFYNCPTNPKWYDKNRWEDQ